MEQGRRSFLKTLGLLPAASAVRPDAAAAPGPPDPKNPRSGDATYEYLSPREVEFVEAALSRLIPADELGPGAKEAGVAVFIDRQLAGDFGTMAREYRLGPWSPGTPEQGYQSRLAPREVYRAAIAEIDARCQQVHGQRFATLPAARQDELLEGLSRGTPPLESAPGPLFFDLLWKNTQEGFFADPIYGGNRDKVGWKLVGFPGVAAVYTAHIEKHGVPYRVEPVSIGDLKAGRARVDAHGHPLHEPLTRPTRSGR